MELSDVTLAEALDRLDAVRDTFTDRFLRGTVSLWVGSKISDARYPDLRALLTRLLDALYADAADPTDLTDPARQAIDEVITLADVRRDGDDPGMYDPAVRFSDWPEAEQETTLNSLQNKYSQVLEVHYARKDILWELLELDKVYGAPGPLPDAEHRLIALLIDEGVVTEVVTTNWDPLVEDAHQQTTSGTAVRPLHVVLKPTDFGNTGTEPKLTKMHGCARAAYEDVNDRELIVAKEGDIVEWTRRQGDPIQAHISHVLRCHPVLYIGLSGQDVNIQAEHVAHRLEVQGDYSPDAPRVLFSAGNVDRNRGRILLRAYGDETYRNHRDDIHERSLVKLYAKPLLAALYVYVIREKLRASVARVADEFRPLADEGVEWLVAYASDVAEHIPDSDDRWRFISSKVARAVGSFVRVYREGAKDEGPWDYTPLSSTTPPFTEPIPQLVLLIGILAVGQDRGYWTFELTPDEPEQLRLRLPFEDASPPIPVYIVRDSSVSPNLLTLADTPESGPYLVIHTSARGVGYRPRASPSAALSLRTTPADREDLYLLDWTQPGDDPVEGLLQDLQTLALAA